MDASLTPLTNIHFIPITFPLSTINFTNLSALEFRLPLRSESNENNFFH
jgi:hypothetical protein